MATVIEWLLNYGIGLRFQKRAAFYNRTAASVVQHRRSALLLSSERDQWESPAFVDAIQKLGLSLGFDRVSPDQAKDLLLACVRQALRQLKRKPQNEELEDLGSSQGSNERGVLDESNTVVSFSLASFPLGFDTGHDVLNDASKVLRLLYAEDLRTLQTRINQLLIMVQNVTANPLTDAGLGKVGI